MLIPGPAIVILMSSTSSSGVLYSFFICFTSFQGVMGRRIRTEQEQRTRLGR